jgi:hypothetical protein
MENNELPMDISDIIQFTEIGMKVTYSTEGVIVFDGDREVIRGYFDKETQLWFFDLVELLNIPDPAYCKGSTVSNYPQATICLSRLKSSEIVKIRSLHKKFSHMAPNALATVLDSGVLDDTPTDIKGSHIITLNKTHQCVICEAGRRKQISSCEGSGSIPGIIGASWSCDYVGPITPATTRGYNGIILFEELAVGYLYGIIVKDKSESYIEAIQNLIVFNNSFGHVAKSMRTDAGSVELGLPFLEEMAKAFTRVDAASPEHQQGNPVERKVQTVFRDIQIILGSSANVSSKQWGPALLHVLQTRNIVPNSRSKLIGDGSKSPQELYTLIRPSFLDFIYEFGEPVTWPATGGPFAKTVIKNGVGPWVGRLLGGSKANIVLIKGNPSVRHGVQPLRIPQREQTQEEIEKLLDINPGDNPFVIKGRVDNDFSLDRWSNEEENTQQYPTDIVDTGWLKLCNEPISGVTKAMTRSQTASIKENEFIDSLNKVDMTNEGAICNNEKVVGDNEIINDNENIEKDGMYCHANNLVRKKRTDDDPTWDNAILSDDYEGWMKGADKEFGDHERRNQIRKVNLDEEAMPEERLIIPVIPRCSTKRNQQKILQRP